MPETDNPQKKRRKKSDLGQGQLDGKARTDTYYKRSRSLLKAAKELAALTGCQLHVG